MYAILLIKRYDKKTSLKPTDLTWVLNSDLTIKCFNDSKAAILHAEAKVDNFSFDYTIISF